jgi:multicomponent Na+:H+ antiporter subunit D
VLLGAGVATALVGAVLGLTREAPTRRVAFVAISHAGLMLLGVGLLSRAGLAGFGVYALASGATKAALFALVAPAPKDTEGWRGARGRRLLLVVAGLILAGLPPAATWLGKGLLEAGATGAGHAAVVALVLVVSVLTGATVVELAVAPGRTDTRAVSSPWALAAGTLLLATTVALGVAPGVTRRSVAAAARFEDRPAYAAAVLGTPPPAAPTVGAPDLGATPALLGVAGAGAAAALGVARGRRRAERPTGAPLARLAALHHGAIADSAAWITFGAAAIGATLAIGVH